MNNIETTNINEQYKRELLFLAKQLDYLKIPFHITQKNLSSISSEDISFYHALGNVDAISKELTVFLKKNIKARNILYVTDEFYCQYILLPLPKTDLIMAVGPYIAGESSYKNIMELLEENYISPEWIPILRREFRNITFLENEAAIIAGINAFADTIWGQNNYKSTQYLRDIDYTIQSLVIPPDAQKRMDLYTNIDTFEQLYADENALILAVSKGQVSKAKSILSNIPLFSLEQRTETVRNLKNHTIIMNTLLRKAVEQGGVHPLYIDQLSSHFAKKIESSTRSDNILELWNDMVQKYCQLVNSHNIKHYALPVQKIITKVDFDISADLSLKAMTEYLNLSPSYLSALFKEETGQTLTDYVNHKRMEYASFQLANTEIPISTIAQSCGILDDNYFTKLFKKYMNKTPSQFRQDYYLERRDKRI